MQPMMTFDKKRHANHSINLPNIEKLNEHNLWKGQANSINGRKKFPSISSTVRRSVPDIVESDMAVPTPRRSSKSVTAVTQKIRCSRRQSGHRDQVRTKVQETRLTDTSHSQCSRTTTEHLKIHWSGGRSGSTSP